MPSSKDLKELHVWGTDDASLGTHEVDGLSRSFLAKYIQTLEPGDAVLDIGCGEGKVLRLLQETKHRCLGIDLNEELVGAARKAGLPAEQMDVMTALERYGNDYNVFCMLDFVEHIPIELLFQILTKIASKPGAKVWIQTPNLDSLIGIKFWFHMPSHVSPLHPFVLRGILRRYNLDIVSEWTDYGAVPWTGIRRWITLKILNALFGPPLTAMFLQGANICLIGRVATGPQVKP
jgi:SAM-dependent methyltransferase